MPLSLVDDFDRADSGIGAGSLGGSWNQTGATLYWGTQVLEIVSNTIQNRDTHASEDAATFEASGSFSDVAMAATMGNVLNDGDAVGLVAAKASTRADGYYITLSNPVSTNNRFSLARVVGSAASEDYAAYVDIGYVLAVGDRFGFRVVDRTSSILIEAYLQRIGQRWTRVAAWTDIAAAKVSGPYYPGIQLGNSNLGVDNILDDYFIGTGPIGTGVVDLARTDNFPKPKLRRRRGL